jgi:hypothetical protein
MTRQLWVLMATALTLAAWRENPHGLLSPAIGAEAPQTEASLEAELTRGLDVKKARVGDPVLAKTTQELKGKGDFRIPKNAKLIGHVTQVQTRGKGQGESILAVVFEKAQLKDGREIPLTALIEAIAPPLSSVSESSAAGPGPDSSAPSGTTGGGMRSASAGLSTSANPAASEKVAASSGGATPPGVFGMKGLRLDRSASAEKGSVIRSSSENVRLESGTRLALRVTIQ